MRYSGGTMALGVGFLIWGFIAPRFSSPKPIATARTQVA